MHALITFCSWIIVSLFFYLQPSPTLAFHCENPLYEGVSGFYCDGNQIYEDLNNCDDPDAEHHKYKEVGNCKENEMCVADNAGDYTTPRTVRCVPSGSSTAVTTGLPPAGIKQLEAAFSQVIKVSVALAFVALLFTIIWGGFKYLMSGGEAKAIQQARQTLTWAIFGILFLVVAWVVLLLIETFTGVNVTTFCLNIQGCK